MAEQTKTRLDQYLTFRLDQEVIAFFKIDGKGTKLLIYKNAEKAAQRPEIAHLKQDTGVTVRQNVLAEAEKAAVPNATDAQDSDFEEY